MSTQKNKNYKLYEKNMLTTMSTLEEFKQLKVSQRKKIIKIIWQHLNEKVKMKGGGADTETSFAAKALPIVQDGYHFVNFLSRVVFPLIINIISKLIYI